MRRILSNVAIVPNYLVEAMVSFGLVGCEKRWTAVVRLFAEPRFVLVSVDCEGRNTRMTDEPANPKFSVLALTRRSPRSQRTMPENF